MIFHLKGSHIEVNNKGIMGKIKENVPGVYYVDEECIGCFICAEIAPRNFRTNHEEGYDYIYKQPQNEEEERMCAEAMDVCPVNAIIVRRNS